MTNIQDEIELLDLNSPTNSAKTFMKKDNKIRSPSYTSTVTAKGDGSPPYISTVTSKGNRGNDITNLFVARAQKKPKSNHTSSIASTSKMHERKRSPRKSDSNSETQEISQLSDDVFLTERKTSIDSPSKADSKSYKDRIKNRFQTIKENAGKSSQRASFEDTTKKLIMERIRKENDEIDTEIRLKRRNFEERIVDRQKKYNFFVGVKDSLEASKVLHTESIAGSDDRNMNESTEQLIDDYNQKDDDTLVQFTYPEYLRYQEKEAEQEWVFRPSGKPVELSRKIVDEEPRYLEDEGLYVPPSAQIPQRQLNLLEERLLGIDDKKWFNCEGGLDILENPINNSSLRPPQYQMTDENLTVFTKPMLDITECQEVSVIKENILHVNLKNLKFDHHPLFSLEHVLETQLFKTCEKYEKYIVNNIHKKISNRLEASRHILLNTEKISGDHRKEKLMKYRKEIKELRESLFIQGQEERQLLKLTLNLWKNLKRLRERNGYSVTSIKLIINKEPVDAEKERKIYEENLQKTYQEILSEYREEFKNKMRAYKNTLKEMQKSPRSESDATTIDSPKKPTYNVDEESVFKQQKARFEECFRSPGEPILRFTVKNDNPISKNIENPLEITRSNLVSSTKIYLKIICNKLTVCKTKLVPLNNNFECYFNENISILLSNIPKFIAIVVVEQTNALQKSVLAEVNLPVPAQSITKSNSKSNGETFERIRIVKYKHEGVGSGINLQKELEKNDLRLQVKIDDVELNISGTVCYSSFWENSGNDRTSYNVDNDDVLEAIVDKNGVIQVNKLAEWISQNKPDPQNPKNSILYEYIQGFDENLTIFHRNKYFRLNPYQRSLLFCDISEIDDNIRMKILQLRNQNEPEFDGMVIPNRTKEIPLNIFKDYKRRIANEREGFLEGDDEEEDYDSKRKNGMKNLKQIHTKVFQKCKSAANNVTIEDVMNEKYLVYFERFIRTVSTNFFNWFRWKPHISHPLPELKKSNVEKIQSSHLEISSLVKISVKVLNGINIPDRDFSVQKIQNVVTDETPRNSIVKPYVEVRYNDIFDRTSVAESTQPIWNEELSLIFNPSHFDYLNPNALCGSILISVFDDVDQNIQLKDVKTKNWLGSLEAPLSAICSNNGMEGYFKLDLPNVIFGYVKRDIPSNGNQNATSTQTYLHLQFSMQPNVPKLTPSVDELPCSDLPYIRDYIIKWNESYNNSFPQRKFSALAINSSGKTTCLVRYIKALEPPQLNNEGFDIEPDQCARFISLIPFTNCNYFYQNVWLSTDQFLHSSIGSIIDHAVALTCFLLALKLDVWLLLGFGIPFGSTAYVLLREHSKETELPLYFIYDVVHGEKINVLDAYCPLQRVYCVVRERNIWANIQRNDNIAVTRFDLSRRSDWLPLFNDEVSAPTSSVHNSIVYTPRKIADELELQLERKIRKYISKSRQLNRTIWNKRVSNIIKNNIHLLEYVYMHGRSNQEICHELSRNISDYDVCGYVLSLPYTSISNIMKKIKTYGVYFQESEDAEFSLVVQFQPQPSYIASVWIFLATVKEK